MMKCIYVVFILSVFLFLFVSCSSRHENSDAQGQQKYESEQNSSTNDTSNQQENKKEQDLPVGERGVNEGNKNERGQSSIDKNDQTLPDKKNQKIHKDENESTSQVSIKQIQDMSNSKNGLNNEWIADRIDQPTVQDNTNENHETTNDKYSKCGVGGNRICTKPEIERINLIQGFIDEIVKRSLNVNYFQDKYKYVKTDSFDRENKKVYFLGEFHVHLESIIDNYSFILNRINNEDVILLEGNGDKDYFDCRTLLIFEIYTIYSYNELSKKRKEDNLYYSPFEMSYFKKKWSEPEFDGVFYALDKSDIKKLKCRFWDDLKEKDNFSTINNHRRNRSLARTVLEDLKNSSVFVVAGAYHSPLGEYLYVKKESSIDGVSISDLYDGCYLNLTYKTPTKKENCPALALIDDQLFLYEWIDNHIEEKKVKNVERILDNVQLPFNRGIAHLSKNQCDLILPDGASTYYETKYIYDLFLDKPVIYYIHKELLNDTDLLNFPLSI